MLFQLRLFFPSSREGVNNSPVVSVHLNYADYIHVTDNDIKLSVRAYVVYNREDTIAKGLNSAIVGIAQVGH